MAIPLRFLAGLIGGSGADLAKGAFSFGLQPFLQRGVSGLNQVANASIPNAPVPFELLLRAKTVGLITFDDFVKLSRSHGIAIGPANRDADWGKWWANCLYSTLPTPSPEVIEDMWRTGHLAGMFRGTDGANQEHDLRIGLQRSGVSFRQWQDYIRDVDAKLPISDLTYLYWIAKNHADEFLVPDGFNLRWVLDQAKRSGVKTETLMHHISTWAGNVDFQQLADAMLRGVITDKEWRVELTKLGYWEPAERRIAELALKNIPPYTDILQIAVKEGWDLPTVQRFGYDDEFPPEFRHWMGKLGYNWGEDVPNNQGQMVPGVPWPELLWRAHWQPIAPTQAYQMQQRLNANNLWRFQGFVRGVEGWTQADTEQILKVADYPPKLRARLAAISYNPLGVRIVRRLFAASVYVPSLITDHMSQFGNAKGVAADDKAEFARFQALDSGLSPPDAELYSALLLAEDQIAHDAPDRARVKRLADERAKIVLDGYRNGQVTQEQLGGVLAALNWSAAAIDLARDNADLSRRVSMGKFLLTRVRHDYYAGIYDGNQARAFWMARGVEQEWANYYITAWSLAFTRARRQFSTEKIVSLYVEGYIANAAASVRLLNLGWTNVDTLLLLAEGNARIADKNARVLQAGARSQERSARELERIARQHVSDLERVRSNLRRIYPITKLNRLLKQGKITQDTYTEKLTAQGYSDEDIALQLLDIVPDNDYTETTLRALLKAELIDEAEFSTRMKEFGYDNDEIVKIGSLVTAKPSANGTQTTVP